MALTGAALLSNRVWAVVIVIGFFVGIRQCFVRHEETQMQATLADAYSQYGQQTRRWL